MKKQNIYELTHPKNVVDDFFIGNSHVIITDDSSCRDEEIDKILESIGQLGLERLPAEFFEVQVIST